jgi:hypothetical protein
MSNAFAWVVHQSQINASGLSMAGSQSGPKCIVDGTSVVVGGNVIPGTGNC